MSDIDMIRLDDLQPEKGSETVSRSPNFSAQEEDILVNLILQYKAIIINKATNSKANHAKDEAWKRIAIEFNKHNLPYNRDIDCLKVKWENLKRKVKRNIHSFKEDRSEIIEKIAQIMLESDSLGPVADVSLDTNNGNMSEANDGSGTFTNDVWKQDEKLLDSDNSSDDDDDLLKQRSLKRSMNFSPRECRLLLNCVRREKDYIMMKELTPETKIQKHRAWMRVVNMFNTQSPEKRTLKVLKTKLSNMKRRIPTTVQSKINTMARDKEYPKFTSKQKKKIKIEPELEEQSNQSYNLMFEPPPSIPPPNVPLEPVDSDPLDIVLNGDSGNISTEDANVHDAKEVISLKIELLKYQLETAKIERQRLMEAMHLEKSDQQSRATETSLRLRAARLETIAAESKLPRNHPALRYTQEEALAQQYMANHSVTSEHLVT